VLIERIDDLLPAVRGRSDFVVINKGSYIAIDYVYQDQDTFSDPRRLECRGIKFASSGEIMARPLRKFFNLGEKQQPHEIDLSLAHVVLEKLDGSMIHPALVDGNLVLMTRKGVTDVAVKAAGRFLWQSNYSEMMLSLLRKGMTPIFEYTAPDNRIVLRYETPALTLLMVRETVTGEHMAFADARALADRHEVPHVGTLDAMPCISDIRAFMEHTRALEDAEGYVVHFDDGHMLKMKAEDYVRKHRALDDMASKKKVAALVLQGFEDDVIPMLDPADAAELREFSTDVNQQVAAVESKVREAVRLGNGIERKQFALEVAPQYPDWMRSALFKHLDGHDPALVIRAMLEKRPELIEAQWRGE
jgi:RNA ligase